MHRVRAWWVSACAASGILGGVLLVPAAAFSEESTSNLFLPAYQESGFPTVDEVIQAKVKKHSIAVIVSIAALLLMPVFGFRLSSAFVIIAAVWFTDVFFKPHPLILMTVPLGLASYFLIKNEFRSEE